MLTALRLEIATPEDGGVLADISRRAFDSDSEVGAPEAEGPPGYASAAWQREMMRKASAYWKVMLDSRPIGGAIVFAYPRGRYYLARIFIDPDHHRRGLGTQAMAAIFALYPEARTWQLETPPWNTRTRAFYEKLGFRVARETVDDVYYRLDLAPHGA